MLIPCVCLLILIVQSLHLVLRSAQFHLILHNLLVQLLNYVLDILHPNPLLSHFSLTSLLLLIHHLLFQRLQRLHQLLIPAPLCLHLLIQPLHLILQKYVLLVVSCKATF